MDLYAFIDELEKIARVPRAVKMYRRALQMAQEGKFDYHGVKQPESMLSILRDKALKGAHGRRELEGLSGVYFQKAVPASGFYGRPGHGANFAIATPSESNVLRGAVAEKVNPQWLFTKTEGASGRLPLSKGDVVIAPKHGPGGKVFRDALESVQRSHKVRHIEPSIFNAAMLPKMLAKTHEPVQKAYTKKELIKMLTKGRTSYPIQSRPAAQ